MNKIVCQVCGTSYPENAAQCPICGYVQSGDRFMEPDSNESSYTYVKGGRFSKSNVKKRNQANQSVREDAAEPVRERRGKPKKKTNVGLIILTTILLLAIIAVLGYITLRFFLPNDFLYEGVGNLKLPDSEQYAEELAPLTTFAPKPDAAEATVPETQPLDCTGVILSESQIIIDDIGKTYQLNVTVEPADTPDLVSYTSSDAAVATVDDTGMITAVAEGNAVITVSCGSVSAECSVQCMKQEEEIVLEFNRKEITFHTEGEAWVLYDGDIPTEDITWESDHTDVATIENGKVVAVAEGDTIVRGTYEGESVACVIHCVFEEEQEEDTGVSEADGNTGKTYTLFNPYGHADDVTINIGEVFTLKLVDENLNDAPGTTWKVSNESVCSFDDGTVKGLASGYAEVTATCEGKTYTCVVRVN